MDKEKNAANRYPDLRRKAEERIDSHQGATGTFLENLDDKRLLHELQVHQVELEMQYDELLQAQTDLLAERSLSKELVTWLAQTSSRENGEPFFNKLARYLATCLEIDFVCIYSFEGDGSTAHTLAVWCDGHFEDNVTYALKDTACGEVSGKHLCCFPAAVCQLFPRDQVLQKLRAESYIGVTLWGQTGSPIGLIAIISRRPLENRQQTEALMQLVSERAAAELERIIITEALRDREHELEEAQLLAGTGSWTYNPVTRKAMWSKGMFTIWRRDPTRGLFPAEDHQKDIHHEDLPQFEAALKEAVEHGIPYKMELRINLPNGGKKTIITICEPQRDTSGNVVKLRGSIQDITERKQFENTLKESEYFFKESQRAASVGSYYADFSAGKWESSEVLDSIFGIDRDYDRSIQGWLDIVHPDDKDKMARYLMEDIISNRKYFSMEYRIIRKNDGETRWVNGRGSAEFDSDGDIMSLRGTIQDITERKRTEQEKLVLEQQLQQAQKLESLGVLAGGIAHDFNNILAIIVAHCSLATKVPARSENSIPEIEKAAQRGAELCRQMLAYAGKAQLAQSKFDLGGLVDEMVKMLKSTLPKNVAIKLNSLTGMPFVAGDASQIRQVVMNLIINASEAIGESHGEIRVSLTKTAVEAGQPVKDHLGKNISPTLYACLEVTDNGCGMDNETRQRLFEPFYSTKFTGRGLGMSAVLGIITSHGGALQLFSQSGQGSTFKVYIPVQTSDSVGDESTRHVSSVPWKGSGTILLVEDEEMIIPIAQTMLEKLGFTIIAASNGREALELYQKHVADITLVVTDMGMPVMDGYALLRELKLRNHSLPIIVSSGFGDAVVSSRIAPGAIAGLISKPYTFDQLQDVLKNVLEGIHPTHA